MFKGQRSKISGAQAEAFVAYVKKTSIPAIRAFLEPHLKVVEMVKAGKSRAAITRYWEPIRFSFTRAGGWARNLGGVGKLLGRTMLIPKLDSIVSDIREEIEMARAGYHSLPVDSDGNPTDKPTTYFQWFPKDTPDPRGQVIY